MNRETLNELAVRTHHPSIDDYSPIVASTYRTRMANTINTIDPVIRTDQTEIVLDAVREAMPLHFGNCPEHIDFVIKDARVSLGVYVPFQERQTVSNYGKVTQLLKQYRESMVNHGAYCAEGPVVDTRCKLCREYDELFNDSSSVVSERRDVSIDEVDNSEPWQRTTNDPEGKLAEERRQEEKLDWERIQRSAIQAESYPDWAKGSEVNEPSRDSDLPSKYDLKLDSNLLELRDIIVKLTEIVETMVDGYDQLKHRIDLLEGKKQ